MKHIDRPWNYEKEPVVREALAADHAHQVRLLADSEGWRLMADALRSQVTETLNDLARSAKEDEQNRGVIRALNHVLSMPENLIRAAEAELNKHR